MGVVSIAALLLVSVAFVASPSRSAATPPETAMPSPGRTGTASATPRPTESADVSPGPTESAQPSPRPTATAEATPGPSERPDIVVLMLDDAPPDDALFHRGMPKSMAFFDKGVRFDRFSGNDPLCCPGRAAFLTGQRSTNHGVTENDATLLDPSMTIATQLQGAGYHTIIAGKYLNGSGDLVDKTPPGWDAVAIMAGSYFDYALWRDGVHEPRGSAPEDYSADVVAGSSVDLLRQAPRDQPVFLYLSAYAPHSDGLRSLLPLPAPRHADDPRCDGIGTRAGPAYNEADMSDKPAFLDDFRPVGFADGWPLEPACRALLSVDQMFTRVRAEMARQGRTNVISILTADNGMAWGDHRWATKAMPFATPMPLYVRWPGHDGGSRTVSEYVQNIDLAPTLASIAGTSIGPFADGRPGPDGIDVSRLITEPGATLQRPSLVEERDHIEGLRIPGWYALRTTNRHALGLWHYVEWKDGSRELYDLAADPHELQNRAGDGSTATIQQALAAELDHLRRQ